MDFLEAIFIGILFALLMIPVILVLALIDAAVLQWLLHPIHAFAQFQYWDWYRIVLAFSFVSLGTGIKASRD